MNLSDVISLPQLLHREARCHAAHQCRYNCWEAFSQSTLFSVPACMYEFKMRSFFCMKKKKSFRHRTLAHIQRKNTNCLALATSLSYPTKYRSQDGTLLRTHWFSVPEQYITFIAFLISFSLSTKNHLFTEMCWAWPLWEQALNSTKVPCIETHLCGKPLAGWKHQELKPLAKALSK